MSRTLEITTVVGCPILCAYCPQQRLIRVYNGVRAMALSTFKKCIDKLSEDTIIDFSGMAEPWTNPDCTEMVMYAAKKHVIAVYTTAQGLTIEAIDRIKGVPFKHFCIHLPDVSGKTRIKVTAEYAHVVQACVKHIPNHSFVVYGELHPAIKALGIEATSAEKALISRANNTPETSAAPAFKTGVLKCLSCSDRLDHNVLLPDGTVTLCCMDYSMKHVLGNLLHQSYESLFESEAYVSVVKGLSMPDLNILCRRCENSAIL